MNNAMPSSVKTTTIPRRAMRFSQSLSPEP
jgi:hypothetical protein